MLLSLLLTSQLWLMSDRASIWNADKISDHTVFMQGSNLTESAFDSEEIRGKNVLLLIHGYNNNSKEALSTYRLINAHVSAFKDNRQTKFYDIVLGYLWPGNDQSVEYYDARRHVSELAKTLRSHLEFLAASSGKVDVLAHSMWNNHVLEALIYPSIGNKKIDKNFK